MTDVVSDEEIASEAARQISLETGLPFHAAKVSVDGFAGWRVGYQAQVEEGLGFDLLLAIGFRSVEVTMRPTRFSGPLVRAFAANVAADPRGWIDQLARVRSAGATVTVYADHEVLSSNAELPDLEYRTLEIECVVRTVGRGIEARRDAALAACRAAVSLTLSGLELQATEMIEDLSEGAVVRVDVNKYERNPVARMQCIAHYGSRCWACDLSFADTYGDLGAGYIHVHHRVLVSSYEGETYVVDPIRDLVPLCPNCHMMIHRRRPPLEPSELRRILDLPEKQPLPSISTESA
ncbi:HNH endonuclease [Nocardioides alcanivorans]|uniref:HNH endonuclease n=1 Tax=Nocardioides alcanivorans TaxID=2897352 RepID=UPI001F3B87C8|nr:hypothetical protein [Nocardioides alcanivorans]